MRCAPSRQDDLTHRHRASVPTTCRQSKCRTRSLAPARRRRLRPPTADSCVLRRRCVDILAHAPSSVARRRTLIVGAQRQRVDLLQALVRKPCSIARSTRTDVTPKRRTDCDQSGRQMRRPSAARPARRRRRPTSNCTAATSALATRRLNAAFHHNESRRRSKSQQTRIFDQLTQRVHKANKSDKFKIQTDT